MPQSTRIARRFAAHTRPDKYRPNQKRMDDRTRLALNEIREMHTEWKKKLEEGTVEGELSAEGSDD